MAEAERADEASAPAAPSMRAFLGYFLRLGTFGFGGPIALAGYMQRDLVERRGWISKQDYVEGLALAQLAPGPLAAQLAVYLGWIRGRLLGATLVAGAFILPSFLMVLILAALYVRFDGLAWMQGAFYGIGAAVIAIIARSAVKLVKMTIGRDKLLWGIFAVCAVVTAWTESEIVWIFFLAGFVALFLKAPPAWATRRSAAMFAPGSLSWLLSGLDGAASAPLLAKIALYFAEAGALVFGSGLAIVPFLHAGVVVDFGWLSERQFLDAVAVAMITPGPVVITVAFIGFLVSGLVGAVAAAIGVFLPCYLFVIVPAPYYRRFAGNRSLKAFVDGVTAAATGTIAGAAFVLGRRAIFDLPTALVAVATVLVLLRFKRISEPLVILAAGLVGILLRAAALQG